MITGDVKEKDHRIRLTQEELAWITEALDHMNKEHWDYSGRSGEIAAKLRLARRLRPDALGKSRRW